ncbi:hypothetical protein D3C87_1725780 [compost metagenome]
MAESRRAEDPVRAHRVARRTFNFQHFGAEIRKDLRCVRAAQNSRQVNHLEPVQGTIDLRMSRF